MGCTTSSPPASAPLPATQKQPQPQLAKQYRTPVKQPSQALAKQAKPPHLSLGTPSQPSSRSGSVDSIADFYRPSWVRNDLGFKAHLAQVHAFSKLEQHYEFGKLIGEGITGQVRLGRNKIDENVYALKSLNVGKMDEAQVNELRAEIEMLRHLDHPKVVSLVEVFDSPNNMCLVMEYCSGGDLSDRRFKSEFELASVLTQILTAIAHCHFSGVIHRDIKVENVLFASRESDQIRLIDFGLSKFFQAEVPIEEQMGLANNLARLNEKARMMETICGTVCYMAPEVLSKRYSEKADIWAIGIIAYTLMTGSAPFVGFDDRETLRRVRYGMIKYDDDAWKRLTPAAKSFTQTLLTVDPDQRPSAVEALKLPWIKTFRKYYRKKYPLDKDFGKQVLDCIIRFAGYPMLKKVALMVIAYHAKQSEKNRLQDLFLWLDEDEFRGALSCKQIYKLIEHFGNKDEMTEEQFQAVFEVLDQDKTGYVHQMEFLSATIETIITPSKKLLDHAFDHLDANSTGYISVQNLVDLLGPRFKRADAEKILRSGYRSCNLPSKTHVEREDFFSMMHAVFDEIPSSPEKDNVQVSSSDDTIFERLDGVTLSQNEFPQDANTLPSDPPLPNDRATRTSDCSTDIPNAIFHHDAPVVSDEGSPTIAQQQQG